MTKRTPLELAKLVKLDRLSRNYRRLLVSRPRVDTGLGYAVDGGYQDVQNLEGAKAIGATQVRDADNVMRDVAPDEWGTILTAVRQHAAARFQHKWQIEAAIRSAASLSELDAIDIDL